MDTVDVISSITAPQVTVTKELLNACIPCFDCLFERQHFFVEREYVDPEYDDDLQEWRRIELCVTLSQDSAEPQKFTVLLYHAFPGAPLGVLIHEGVIACLGEHEQCVTMDAQKLRIASVVLKWYNHLTHDVCSFPFPLSDFDDTTNTDSEMESDTESSMSIKSTVSAS